MSAPGQPVRVSAPAGDQHVVLAAADDRGFLSLRLPPTPRRERYTLGRRLRDRIPRSALGAWEPPADRPDPVELIMEAHAGRLEWLIPVRVGRMVASPYAFLHGIRWVSRVSRIGG